MLFQPIIFPEKVMNSLNISSDKNLKVYRRPFKPWWNFQMFSFGEGQAGISRSLNTNSHLPFSVSQDPTSDVEDKLFDIQNQWSRLHQNVINCTFWRKNGARTGHRCGLNNDACQHWQQFLAFLSEETFRILLHGQKISVLYRFIQASRTFYAETSKRKLQSLFLEKNDIENWNGSKL